MLELKARKLVWGSAKMPKSLLCPCSTHIGHRSAGDTYACLDETHTHTHTYKYIFGHSWNSPETQSWHSEVKIWRWILITQQNLNHWSSYSNQIKEARVCHFGWCTWLGFVWTQMHTRPSTIFCSSIWSEMIRNRTQYGSDLVWNGLKLDLIWAKILYKKK